ncbi:MAG: hypothetical protein HWD60_01275 [Defluviicoccus sp.]|nr:MAG: hypothetical protein HWD60_01275 [Defluviicoccus sp.]
MLNEALDVARTISDKWRRADALAALAPQLSGEERSRVLNEALDVARTIRDEWHRARTLRRSPHS